MYIHCKGRSIEFLGFLWKLNEVAYFCNCLFLLPWLSISYWIEYLYGCFLWSTVRKSLLFSFEWNFCLIEDWVYWAHNQLDLASLNCIIFQYSGLLWDFSYFGGLKNSYGFNATQPITDTSIVICSPASPLEFF